MKKDWRKELKDYCMFKTPSGRFIVDEDKYYQLEKFIAQELAAAKEEGAREERGKNKIHRRVLAQLKLPVWECGYRGNYYGPFNSVEQAEMFGEFYKYRNEKVLRYGGRTGYEWSVRKWDSLEEFLRASTRRPTH